MWEKFLGKGSEMRMFPRGGGKRNKNIMGNILSKEANEGS